MIILSGNVAHATPIDLNSFFADPSVSVAINGLSALINEDFLISPVLLANDPGLGDPNIIIPAANTALFFDYDFSTATTEADEFGAFVIDSATGFSVGEAFEFFTAASGQGTVWFDLTSLVGGTLGLQFQLSSLVGDTGIASFVTISNVRLDPLPSAGIPEPPMLWLFVTIMLGLCVHQRRKRQYLI